MIAQGCKHTKNTNKYLLRLGIFALISEIPFDLAFNYNLWSDGAQGLGANFLINTNVFYTLFLGVACVVVYEKLKKKKRQWLALFATVILPLSIFVNITPFSSYGSIIVRIASLAGVIAVFYVAYFLPNADEGNEITIRRKIVPIVSALPMLFAAGMLHTNYGAFGVGLIFVLYLTNPENRISRSIVLTAGIVYHYGLHVISRQGILVDGMVVNSGYALNIRELFHFLFALISVIIIFLYNGKQGPKFKWAFYVFYPAHIAVLAAIWFIFVRV